MIVVKAEIWPHGQSPDSVHGRAVDADVGLHVGTLIIVNNGMGNSDLGFYDLYRGDPEKRAGWECVGHIDAFPRGRRQSHAHILVDKAIKTVGIK